MANLDKVCRACLNTKETLKYDFRENVSHELYLFCTSVVVSLNDNLPKLICNTCYDLLNSYAEFKKTCQQSNQKLISLYENKEGAMVAVEVSVKEEHVDDDFQDNQSNYDDGTKHGNETSSDHADDDNYEESKVEISFSSTEMDDPLELTPPVNMEETKTAETESLPQKSRDRYMVAYENFILWQAKRKSKSFSENVFLAYFTDLSSKYKASTLWAIYSMLKSTVKTKNDIDIKSYSKLSTFIKRQADGYKSKKSKVLSAENIEKFLNDAPDHKYLLTKTILIFGITGACRTQELSSLNVNDIENHGELMLVKIPNSSNKIPRTFTIHGDFYQIVKKYEALRVTTGNPRFFQNYQNGKCTRQVVGVNKIGNMPKKIAKFLNLPDAEHYTGHSFRRTSATLLANSGSDGTMKRLTK